MGKETTKKQPLNTSLAVLPISTIASALNVHQRTLRIYDNEGILSPKRTAKNRRNYSLDDLEKAKLILFLTRNLALNLSGVKIILAILEKTKLNPWNTLAILKKLLNKLELTPKFKKITLKKPQKEEENLRARNKLKRFFCFI